MISSRINSLKTANENNEVGVMSSVVLSMYQETNDLTE